MANFIRRAKPGNDWTSNELLAYNITVVEKDEQAFFCAPLPEYTGPAGFIQHEDLIQGLDKDSLALIKRLNLASGKVEEEESAVGDFATEVLRALGYEKEKTVVRGRKNLGLSVCQEEMYVKTDVFIQDVASEILLLFQEDTSDINFFVNPEARIVAQAIAAFQENNANRHYESFLPRLQSYVFPGITMMRTFPRFYKIKVTHDLDQAVRAGQHPAVKTIVERHTPRVSGGRNEGMRPLDNRVKILQCFEAFKRFVYPQDDNN